MDVLGQKGIGSIAFSPLEQGILTNKYLEGLPEDSRAVKDARYLKSDQITPEVLAKVAKLNAIAESRNQSLAQMALAWVLRDEKITTVLVGVSKTSQLLDNIQALDHVDFSADELQQIETILKA